MVLPVNQNRSILERRPVPVLLATIGLLVGILYYKQQQVLSLQIQLGNSYKASVASLPAADGSTPEILEVATAVEPVSLEEASGSAAAKGMGVDYNQRASQSVCGSAAGGLHGRKTIRIFVGVFTGFNNGSAEAKYNYYLRRKMLRSTWFPADAAAHQMWERESGVVFRFIIGHSAALEQEAALAAEEQERGDFLRLPLLEGYGGLPNKTRTFFAAAAAQYAADWYVKMDDDVYLMPERLLAASLQWRQMGADYIGCMKHGYVWNKPGTRWFEPQGLLVGPTYWLHAYGSLYVLSRRSVDCTIVRNFHQLRMLANEDTSMGSWLLGHNTMYFEDMRLCSPQCGTAAVAVSPVACAGLCKPLEDLVRLHVDPVCQRPAPQPLQYMPSYPEHKAFERMWV